jgi:hypothetical protein
MDPYQLYHITIVVLLITGCLYWFVFKRPVNLRKYVNWRRVQLASGISLSDVEERIRKLYRSKMCLSVGMSEDVIYFKDKPTLFTWGNTYVVKQGDDDQHVTLYCRGSMLEFNVDKTHLSSMIFCLGGRS